MQVKIVVDVELDEEVVEQLSFFRVIRMRALQKQLEDLPETISVLKERCSESPNEETIRSVLEKKLSDLKEASKSETSWFYADELQMVGDLMDSSKESILETD